MHALIILSIGLAMQLSPSTEPAQILQIYRDFLKPGTYAEYREIEEDAARICARLKCPNPYLAIESLSGPKEVWYLNGYRSAAHQTAVVEGYQNNAPLMTALNTIPIRKAGLILAPVDTITRYRQELTSARPWCLGEGRFLVIAEGKHHENAKGTVFEADDGTRFSIRSAQSRKEADGMTADEPAKARVFAVRPTMSMPSQEWIGSDPEFWRPKTR